MTRLLVDTLAALRLARLAADDTITVPHRDRLFLTANDSDRALHRPAVFALELLDCPWCLTVWCAAAVTAARMAAPRLADHVLRFLAVAEAAGFARWVSEVATDTPVNAYSDDRGPTS